MIAVGKSSKLFTLSTQGSEVMGSVGVEPAAKRVPQSLQGPLTGENTKSLRKFAWPEEVLPMYSAVSESMPLFRAAVAALMAADDESGAPSVAMLIIELMPELKLLDAVIKLVMAVMPAAVFVVLPGYAMPLMAATMPGSEAAVTTVGATTVVVPDEKVTTVTSIEPSVGRAANAAA